MDDCLAQIRRGARSRDAAIASRALVLQVVSQVIHEQRPSKNTTSPPSPTEYFAALMTALEPIGDNVSSDALEPKTVGVILQKTNCNELMHLLNACLPHVPQAVVLSKHEACLGVFVKLNSAVTKVLSHVNQLGGGAKKQAIVSGATSIAKNTITSTGLILGYVEPSKSKWDKPVMVHAFHIILASLGAEKPKVRRCGQMALRDVFMNNLNSKAAATPAVLIAVDVITKVLEDCSISDCVRTLQLLAYLPSIIPFLVQSKKGIQIISTHLVRLANLGHSMLALSALRSIDSILTNGMVNSNAHSFTAKFATQFTQALVDLHAEKDSKRNSVENDPQVAVAWVMVLKHSLELVKLVDPNALQRYIPKAVKCVVSLFAYTDVTVNQAFGTALVSIIQMAMEPALVRQAHVALQSGGTKTTPVLETIQSMALIVSPQYQHAWPNALLGVSTLFECMGNEGQLLLQDILIQLIKVRESLVDPSTGEEKTSADWRVSVEKAIGSAIAGFGAEGFLSLVPIRKEVHDCTVLDPVRVWVVPLLRQYLKECPTTLMYFRVEILRIAKGCMELAASGRVGETTAKVLQTRSMQLYALLPSFCTNASDISAPQGFKAIAKTLGDGLANTDHPELCEYICKGVVHLIEDNIRAANPVDEEDFDEEWDSDFEEDSDFGEDMDDDDEDADSVAGNVDMKTMRSSNARSRRTRKTLVRGGRNLLTLPVYYAKTDAEQNLEAISKFAKNFLPLLFNCYDLTVREMDANPGSTGAASERAVVIHQLIGSYSSIAPQPLLNDLFAKLVQKLLAATSAKEDDMASEEQVAENKHQANTLTSLATDMVPALDNEHIDMLYRVLRPAIDDEESQAMVSGAVLQKRAYKVLETICEHNTGWIVKNREDLISLMRAALMSSSLSAKTSRLQCLKLIIRALYRPSKEAADVAAVEWDDIKLAVSDLLGEVILCTKEPNYKARTASFRVIHEMGKCMDVTYRHAATEGAHQDVQGGGVGEFLRMLVAGLAAKTPHMRSATVVSISRVLTDFGSRSEVQGMLPEILCTVLLLLEEKSREVAKSCIGFCKVCVVRLPLDTLEKVLDDLIRGLMPWAKDPKNRFRMKIRIIFERLVKKFGVERLTANGAIPEDHTILTYIRKTTEYKKRKYLRDRGIDAMETEGAAEDNNNNNDDNESDSDNDGSSESEDDMDDGRSSRKRKRRLDGSTMNTGKKGGAKKREGRATGGGVLEGARIVEDAGSTDAVDLLDASALGRLIIGSKQQTKKSRKTTVKEVDFKYAPDGRMIIEDGETGSKKADDLLSSDDEDFVQSRKKRAVGKNGDVKAVGSEYRSKKATGDVRKKGQKFEPFAYMPLNNSMLNKRNKHDAVKQFRGLVKKGKKSRQVESGGRNGHKKGGRR